MKLSTSSLFFTVSNVVNDYLATVIKVLIFVPSIICIEILYKKAPIELMLAHSTEQSYQTDTS